MKIALDAMGGDFAPKSIIEGAVIARNEVLKPETELILIGKEDIIKDHLSQLGANASDFTIVNAESVIEMGEHPTKAFTQKQDSSIAIGFGMLKAQQSDVFCSCGNTGAMLVGSMFTIKAIEGVLRPGIAGWFPKLDGYGIVMDVGANADCKPEALDQFAILGSLYVKHVMGKENPTVGLLNMGEEEGKGNLLTQQAFQLLKVNPKINFIGNIEGRDFFNSKADVIVCDGYTGNVVLKMGEEFYEILKERNIKDEFIDRFDYSHVGGSPILGVNGNVIIGHGVSNPTAIKNMISLAEQTAYSKVADHIKQAFK